VGGLADLASGRVRFIGDPVARIREDFLRGLRFFRFHAAFGRGAPDPEALHAIVAERAGLLRLSRERVRSEMLKLMAAPGVVAMAEVMADTGIFTLLTGGVPRLARLGRVVAIEAGWDAPADALRRLGALALFVEEDAVRLRDRLRLSTDEARRLAAMAAPLFLMSAGSAGRGELPAKAALYRLGPASFVDRAMLAWSDARAAADDPAWRALVDLPGRWAPPPFPSAARISSPAASCLAQGSARRCESWKAIGSPPAFRWSRPGVTRPSNGASRVDRYGHFTTGGREDRIEATLPPVFRPNTVPRS
jgi:poly(A) polymerase